MNMQMERKLIGRSRKQAIKLQKYGSHVSLVIGTPSLDGIAAASAHAIRLTPALTRKTRVALEQLEHGEL